MALVLLSHLQDRLRLRERSDAVISVYAMESGPFTPKECDLRSETRRRCVVALVYACGLSLWATQAWAFCGFYVSGATQEMYNEATMVVLMREGTKTALSMRNDYQGPAEDFALVIPVPEVLKEKQVKTLDPELFARIDALAAPRLVEYWEQDPCREIKYERIGGSGRPMPFRSMADGAPVQRKGVKIEAQFKVGEYDVVILSAGESSGLESWLVENKYNIPPGAKDVLAPYIAAGQYFFVAKVDPQKVKFSKDGRALLSPLRFDYDAKEFALPVRLGLLNAKGPQDLLVHILAKGQRYEVANLKNMPIPTNLVVKTSTRDNFPQFYTSLIDATLEAHPGTVLTEYAWNAFSCDPCPIMPLQREELASLGADVMPEDAPEPRSNPNLGSRGQWRPKGWTLTRLHARYTREEMTQDLVFAQAPALVGGRGMPQGVEGILEEKTRPGGRISSFQGRYVMLNPWEGKIECEKPNRGMWGGPPNGGENPVHVSQQTAATQAMRKDFQVASFIARDAPDYLTSAKPEAAVEAADKTPSKTEAEPVAAPKENAEPGAGQAKKNGCASGGLAPADGGAVRLGVLLAGLMLLRRKRANA